MKIFLGMMRDRDLSQNHRFFGEFTVKNKSFSLGVERYSEIGFNHLSFKRTLHAWGAPITTRSRHPCVSQIPTTPPNSLVLPVPVKLNQPIHSLRSPHQSFVHKVCLWWGEPFGIQAKAVYRRRVENPCVGGSIPPRATKKHQNHLRVVFYLLGL